MRKILIGLVAFAIVSGSLAVPARAQSVALVEPTANEILLQSLINELIGVLRARIELLQQQIAAGREEQAERDRVQDERADRIERANEPDEPEPKPTYKEIRCALKCVVDNGCSRNVWKLAPGSNLNGNPYYRECRLHEFYEDGSGQVSVEDIN